jgi:hypothetical protein
MAGGEPLVDGVMDAIGANSPAKKGIDAGQFMGEGIIQGMNSMTASVRATATFIGNAMVDGIVVSIRSGESRLGAAIRALISSGLAAAREAAETASPSKATMRIGRDLVSGLALGIKMNSQQASRAMSKMVEAALYSGRRTAMEMKWDLADARDAVAAAEKSLREAMKEGSAREVAAAQRAVARAKLAEADAAAAQQLVRLEKLQERFDKLWSRIQDIKDKREAGRKSLVDLFRERFGEPSEFSRAYDAASLSADRAIGLFDNFAEVIRQRFAGIKGGQKDELLKFIRRSTKQLVDLINERDEVLKRLEVARINLARAEAVQKDLQDFLRKPLGEPSELDKALNTANMTVDSVISLYDRLSKVIEQRFTSSVRDDKGNIVEQFSDAGKALLATLEAESRRLVALVKRRDDVLQRLAEAEKRLDELTQARANMASTIRSTFQNLFKADSDIGSAELYIRGLNQRLNATKDFIRGIEALRARGLDEGLLRELIEAGPERSRALVGALAGASDAQLAEINAIRDAGMGLSDAYAEYAADVTYGDEIESATKAVGELRTERDNILAEMAQIVAGIEKTMEELAASTGEGSVAAAQAIVDGLESRYDAIIAAMDTITQGLFDVLNPLTDAAYDIGKGAMENMLTTLAKGARKVLRQTQQVSQAIADMMAKAMGTKAVQIEIPKNLLKQLDTAAKGQKVKVTRPVPVASAAQRSLEAYETVFQSGAVQVQVTVGSGEGTAEVKAAVQAAIVEAMEKVNREAANARR